MMKNTYKICTNKQYQKKQHHNITSLNFYEYIILTSTNLHKFSKTTRKGQICKTQQNLNQFVLVVIAILGKN